jgi:uncharacterized membrane protein YdjX (TVP38/TMEM64 family)
MVVRAARLETSPQERDHAMTRQAAEGDRQAWLRRLAPVLALGAVFVAFFAFGLDSYATFEGLKAHRDALRGLVDANLAVAVLLYIAGYALVTASSIPIASVATLAGGFLFGAVFGTLITVAGATLGATAVFLVARSAFGEPLRARAGPYIGRMEAGFRRNEVSYLMFLRLMPVFPFFVVNLAPAFLGVSTRTYVLTTFLGIIPGTAVYSVVGAGLGAILDRGGDISLGDVVTPEIVIGLAGLAVLSLAPIAWRRWRDRRTPSPSR